MRLNTKVDDEIARVKAENFWNSVHTFFVFGVWILLAGTSVVFITMLLMGKFGPLFGGDFG